ncbi:MAG: GNAT family N-acetyltransferase [Candidatus Dormiibacterota bacterium]
MTQTRFPREVETERLLLRQFRDADFEAYFGLFADAEVRRFIGGGVMPTREDAWRHMAMLAGVWALRGYGQWAVEVRASGNLIGRCGVWFPEGFPEIEAGWVIGRAHWGHGYATEAGREALRQAFATLGVPHVISLIDPENVASRRVAENLGGTIDKTGVFRGHETLFYGYTAPPA